MNIKEKYLLIDIGDTLMSINEPFDVYTKRAIGYIYDRLNPAVTKDKFVKYVFNYRNEIRKRAHQSMIEMPATEFLTNILMHYNLKATDKLIEELEKEYIKAETEVTTLFSDTIFFLERVKENRKVLIAVTNNFSRRLVLLLLIKFGIINYFSNIYISGDIRYRKPHAGFLNTVCLSENIKKSDCIMIGNNIKLDVMAGKNSGIKTCLINRDNKERSVLTKEICPDYTIKNLNEVEVNF